VPRDLLKFFFYFRASAWVFHHERICFSIWLNRHFSSLKFSGDNPPAPPATVSPWWGGGGQSSFPRPSTMPPISTIGRAKSGT
jgi:hypothetical protein